MITLPLITVAFVVPCLLALGALLGHWLCNCRWAENALDYKRIEFDGALYYVVREGDVQKAREVFEGMRGK